jgi:uncharacterized coiled-coil protein SlyX
MLKDISTRLNNLEKAVAESHQQLSQVGFSQDMAIPRIIAKLDILCQSVENLQKTLKTFARGLVEQLMMGWHTGNEEGGARVD